jgi:hypothetical protein
MSAQPDVEALVGDSCFNMIAACAKLMTVVAVRPAGPQRSPCGPYASRGSRAKAALRW